MTAAAAGCENTPRAAIPTAAVNIANRIAVLHGIGEIIFCRGLESQLIECLYFITVDIVIDSTDGDALTKRYMEVSQPVPEMHGNKKGAAPAYRDGPSLREETPKRAPRRQRYRQGSGRRERRILTHLSTYRVRLTFSLVLIDSLGHPTRADEQFVEHSSKHGSVRGDALVLRLPSPSDWFFPNTSPLFRFAGWISNDHLFM